MKKWSILTKKMSWQGIRGWHILIYQLTISSLCGLWWSHVLDPSLGIWDVSLSMYNTGHVISRTNSSFYVLRLSCGKRSIQIEQSSQHSCFTYPLTFIPPFLLAYDEKVPEIRMNYVELCFVELWIAAIWEFLINKEISFVWLNLIPLYLGIFQYVFQKDKNYFKIWPKYHYHTKT